VTSAPRRDRDDVTEKCTRFDSPPVFCWRIRFSVSALSGQIMHSTKLYFALVVFAALAPRAVSAQAALGAQGAEGEPNRLQQWLVPTPVSATPAHAILFRPKGDGPFPLALIAHASTQNVLRRGQMPQPEYRALSAFLVARGFAVLVPERLGHGATSGKYLEDQGGCDEADYARAGRATAGQITSAMDYFARNPSYAAIARSSPATPPAPGGRRPWPARGGLSRPSLRSRRGAAAAPMTFPIGSAHRRP
jgi:hypothetical protein